MCAWVWVWIDKRQTIEIKKKWEGGGRNWGIYRFTSRYLGDCNGP